MRALAFVVLAVASLSVQAQTKGTFITKYDLDATSYTYCNTAGLAGSAYGAPIRVDIPIKTTGSSTTVEAVTVATAPFTNVAVGDILVVRNNDGTSTVRWVRTRADADTVTVDTAVDWSSGSAALGFYYYDVTCGTASTDGWVPVDSAKGSGINVQWQIDQISVTGGIDVRGECQDATLVPVSTTVYPDPADSASTNECKKGNFTTTNACKLIITGKWDRCRLGFKIATADDAGVVVGAPSEDVDFTEDPGGVPKVCTFALTNATYTTCASLCSDFETGIAASACTPDNTYTCTCSATTNKITIARATGTKAVSFNWNTGANTPTSAASHLGFSTAADSTGATSYTGATAVATDEGTNTESISAFVTLEMPR